MIKNRASVAGTSKRRMTGAKTLAAALVLSIAAMSAAHACDGYVTTVNHRDAEIKVKTWLTQRLGEPVATENFSLVPTVPPHSSVRTKIVTTRKKDADFRVIAKLNGEAWKQRYYSNYAKCSDGWTPHVY